MQSPSYVYFQAHFLLQRSPSSLRSLCPDRLSPTTTLPPPRYPRFKILCVPTYFSPFPVPFAAPSFPRKGRPALPLSGPVLWTLSHHPTMEPMLVSTKTFFPTFRTTHLAPPPTPTNLFFSPLNSSVSQRSFPPCFEPGHALPFFAETAKIFKMDFITPHPPPSPLLPHTISFPFCFKEKGLIPQYTTFPPFPHLPAQKNKRL